MYKWRGSGFFLYCWNRHSNIWKPWIFFILDYLTCPVFLPLVYLSYVSLCSLTFILWMNERLIKLETQSFVMWKLIRIIITSDKEFLPQMYMPASSGTAYLLYFTLGNLVNYSRSSVKMKQTSYWVILTNLSLGCLWKFCT